MPDDLSPTVFALARAVSIQSVRFLRTSTEVIGVQQGDVLDKLRIVTKWGGAKSPDDPEGIRAFIGLECAVQPTDQTRDAAKVSCELALDYKVSDPALRERLTEQDFSQFAGLTGMYNAWPFVREFCHSASQRMGLPVPIMLPTLPTLVPQRQQQEAPAQSPTSTQS